jgi:maleylpyruvate isomerase
MPEQSTSRPTPQGSPPAAEAIRLHGYWRSGAAYRVRIALALKGVGYEQVNHDLRFGAQASPDYAALNPQKLVPALETNGTVLTQSTAIIEWLDTRFPGPALLPADPIERALVRGMVATIAADTHPLHNLRVHRYLKERLGADDAALAAWNRHWIGEGLAAVERLIDRHGRGFAFGAAPTMADCFTVPALYSAERFGVDVSGFPALRAAGAAAAALPEVQSAHPLAQPDADPA